MVKGRKPKPTKLKMLEGNPGGRPLNENEPEYVLTKELMVEMIPDGLSFQGLKEWDRLCELLQGQGVVTDADINILQMYINTYDQYLEAQKIIKKSGLLVVNKKTGRIGSNPAINIAKDCTIQLIKMQAELGLTPSSRSRLQINNKPKWKSKTEMRLFGKKK